VDWEKLFKEFQTHCWIILIVLAGGSFFFMSPKFTLGTILGGLLAIANFNVLQHTIRKAFAPDGVMMNNKMTIIVKYYGRLFILGLLIFVLITNGWVEAIGLAVGLSTVVFCIIYFGIRAAWKTSSGEAI